MIHLHTHTEYSFFDGLIKVSELVKETKRRGIRAAAISDHGTVRGFYSLWQECKDHEVKPIYGCELYMVEDYKRYIREGSERGRIFHLTAWAKNSSGLKSLYKISTQASKQKTHRPITDLGLLLSHREGLVLGTACANGLYSRENYSELLRFLRGEGFEIYSEVMPNSLPIQKPINKKALRMADKLGLKIIATVDAHYIQKKDVKIHEILLAIGSKSKWEDPKRFRFGVQEFWMMDDEEVEKFFRRQGILSSGDIVEAMRNTKDFLSFTAQLDVDYHRCVLPQFSAKPVQDLIQFCQRGWELRGIDAKIKRVAKAKGLTVDKMRNVYFERLKYELSIIHKLKFEQFFLIVYDVIKWAKANGIVVGPGRGSSSGSLVSFLLGITLLDPIEFDLIFERFLNPNRQEMPDIDMDFEDERRGEIKQYLVNKYGEEQVAEVGTNIKLKGKGCLKDVSRVFGIPHAEVNKITPFIIERGSGDERVSETITDSFAEFPGCIEFDRQHPEVKPAAVALEGMVKGSGIHAAGVLVTPHPVDDYIPCEIVERHGEEIKTTAFDLYGVAAFGLLKLDLLGLSTLTQLRYCVEAIEKNRGIEVKLEDISVDDPDTIAGFNSKQFTGVFQFDTASMISTTRESIFTSFNDVVVFNALNRPGALRCGMGTSFNKRKLGKEKVPNVHPIFDEITAESLGVIIYQEQVMAIFNRMGGFPLDSADRLRKKIAHSLGIQSFGTEKEEFVKGAMQRGVDKKVADSIMHQMVYFGSYGFNKAHAAAYSLIAWWGMYLKVHFPEEYIWSLLAMENDQDKIAKYLREADRMGVEVKYPDVNKSKNNFELVGRTIYCGLEKIKNVGESAIRSITANQPFSDLNDFFVRVDSKARNKRVLESLCMAGALDKLIESRKMFVENLPKIQSGHKLGRDVRGLTQGPDFSETEKLQGMLRVHPIPTSYHPLKLYSGVLKRIRPEIHISKMGKIPWSSRQYTHFAGILVDIKYNRIGDFHYSEPSEEEKKKIFWGNRYANVNLQDDSGEDRRIKVDADLFEDFRPIVERGVGTPVIALVRLFANYESMRALNLVDLDHLQKVLAGAELPSIWDAYYLRKMIKSKALLKAKDGDACLAWVVDFKKKYDKHGKLMAFTTILDASGFYEAICFGSIYKDVQDKLKHGAVLKLKLNRLKGGKDKGKSFSIEGVSK